MLSPSALVSGGWLSGFCPDSRHARPF